MCQGIVAKLRSDAPNMTTLGIEDLRERTLKEIQELFVGKDISMVVRVRDMVAVGPDRYALIPKILTGAKGTILRSGQFHLVSDCYVP